LDKKALCVEYTDEGADVCNGAPEIEGISPDGVI
jgi:hypothetical protein